MAQPMELLPNDDTFKKVYGKKRDDIIYKIKKYNKANYDFTGTEWKWFTAR